MCQLSKIDRDIIVPESTGRNASLRNGRISVHVAQLVTLFAGTLAVAIVARRLGRQAPLVLVAAGLAASFIPGMPNFDLNPDLVLALVLPPLLYSAALNSSYLNIKANQRPIILLAVGLVLATTVVVGLVAHLTIPNLELPAALVLGAVVAPPDAVAAVSIGRRLGLPRRAMTLLAGESLINDATALTALKVAIAAAIPGPGTMSWGEGVRTFVIAAVGGVLIGLLVGLVVHAVRMCLRGDGVLESALGMLVPFATYLLAEEVSASGVLAVVVAGLYLGHNAPRAGYATRLQETAVWRAVDVLLESLVFALIGLQLASVVRHSQLSWRLLSAGVLILLATIAIRFVWVFLTGYGALAIPAVRRRERVPDWQEVTVVGWAGMRGVVTLAAAFGVPELPDDARAMIVLFAFTITVVTLLLQGTTLPWVIRRLGVRGDEARHDALAEAAVQQRAAEAAKKTLDELVAEGVNAPQQMIDQLRRLAEHRGNAAWERLGRQEEESPASAVRRLRRSMLAAQREVFIAARDAGEIDDEVLQRVVRELDLEEAALYRD